MSMHITPTRLLTDATRPRDCIDVFGTKHARPVSGWAQRRAAP
jgi:hypothetical protein